MAFDETLHAFTGFISVRRRVLSQWHTFSAFHALNVFRAAMVRATIVGFADTVLGWHVVAAQTALFVVVTGILDAARSIDAIACCMIRAGFSGRLWWRRIIIALRLAESCQTMCMIESGEKE